MLGTQSSPPIHAVASGLAPTVIARLHGAGRRVDADDAARLARHPQGSGRGGDPVGVRDRPALRDAAGRRIELEQLPTAVVADPERAVGVQQPVRLDARVEGLDDLVRARVDARDGPLAGVRHPDRTAAGCEAVRPGPDGDARDHAVRARVDARDRAAVEVRDPDAPAAERRERPVAGGDAGDHPAARGVDTDDAARLVGRPASPAAAAISPTRGPIVTLAGSAAPAASEGSASRETSADEPRRPHRLSNYSNLAVVSRWRTPAPRRSSSTSS